MNQPAAQPGDNEPAIPYRAWWGLTACALIIGIIWLIGPYREFELRPRAFTFDYPWKLPEPSSWARFTAWSLYALHQVGVWYLIYKGQSLKLKYVHGLHPVNVQMLGWNVLFVGLHIAQTRLFYDGLAQDVHEASAIGSVVLMMLVVLLMENDRRGLFVGKRVPFPRGVGESLRKYHGYYFAWAITYTFWYHPIEITPGHLMGLFFMMMLFLQGSLFPDAFSRESLVDPVAGNLCGGPRHDSGVVLRHAGQQPVGELPVRRPAGLRAHPDARRKVQALAEVRHCCPQHRRRGLVSMPSIRTCGSTPRHWPSAATVRCSCWQASSG